MNTLIKNGVLCFPGEHFQADLMIENDTISFIGAAGSIQDHEADQVFDADGMYVCPGGIDPHTHMDLQQSEKYRAIDTFASGGIAAACGGTTTIIDHMANGPKGYSLWHQFHVYEKLAADCPVDYSFHGVLQNVDSQILDELGDIIDAGFPSFKAYTTYGYPFSEKQLLPVLRIMREHHGLLAVHCENDAITTLLRSELDEHVLTPIQQALTRPNAAESEAIDMVLSVAHVCQDAPIYIVHLSTHEGLAQIKLARANGQNNIYAETCPQYLLLTDEKFEQGGPSEGIKYIMAPPLRKKQDNDALWGALRDGEIQVVATDHCPFSLQDKQENTSDFRQCPGGVSGVEERMLLLFGKGVQGKRISLDRFVEATSTNAAKIFGLYPKKGTLLPGSDADIVVINPHRPHTFSKDNLHTKCGYSPYENMAVPCSVAAVFLRGKKIAAYNHFIGELGYGKLLKRNRRFES
ncbi:dihydropyrimidinase [uncultured Mitsuokella sp.]|uniref:dihydropyrimidinase n=1 Tax=uncultured Mitsuokella sp. TaxID=453120 RepID=UPI00261E394D|nr:dihydropyrimidinase [uncultured Mitsuokella sp.]